MGHNMEVAPGYRCIDTPYVVVCVNQHEDKLKLLARDDSDSSEVSVTTSHRNVTT